MKRLSNPCPYISVSATTPPEVSVTCETAHFRVLWDDRSRNQRKEPDSLKNNMMLLQGSKEPGFLLQSV